MTDANDDFERLIAEWKQGQPDVPEGFRSGFVAVVGQPNVGKSTLMNHLIGQKVAIVSPKPQTTRRRIRGIVTRPDAQVIFVDTPGIHEPHHRLGELMNEAALTTIPDADAVLFVVQGATVPDDLDRRIAKAVLAVAGPKLLVINKIDQIPQEQATSRYEAYRDLGAWDEVLLISALEGHGTEAVLDWIVEHLPEGPPYYPEGQPTDQSERQIAAEIIREAALRHLDREVPHSLNVEVDEWEVRDNGVAYVSATIFVERDSQKRIVIGAGGQMLKRISSDARREIERTLGTRLFLEIWVKVREKWRNSDNWLGRWGYKTEK